MGKKILFMAVLNIILLFVFYKLIPIGGYIAGFATGFFGVGNIISIIFSFVVIEFVIGWLPYKLFIKPKLRQNE